MESLGGLGRMSQGPDSPEHNFLCINSSAVDKQGRIGDSVNETLEERLSLRTTSVAVYHHLASPDL